MTRLSGCLVAVLVGVALLVPGPSGAIAPTCATTRARLNNPYQCGVTPSSGDAGAVAGPPAPIYPDWSRVLTCIAERESERGRAGDGSGYAINRYQFVQGTWNYAVRLANHPEWAGTRPQYAPHNVQDDAAIMLIVQQHRVGPAWAWYWCNSLIPIPL